MTASGIRRRELCFGGILLGGIAGRARGQQKDDGFRPLCDGVSLRGWKPQPRLPVPRFPGAPEPNRQSESYRRAQATTGSWTVQDGAIVGGQNPPGSGLGAYLVSEEAFDDFELQLEARPDWGADTGILVRTVPEGNIGFQILLDHRPHGGIGGYFGNGLANIHAYQYGLAGEQDQSGRLVRLSAEEPTERTVRVPPDYMAPAETFLRVWKVNGWNQFRIRAVGALPHLTTWINGEKISELDTAKVQAPNYDPKAILARIGRAGHIAFEVHDNFAGDSIGQDRWRKGAVCRWRNIAVKKLSA